jgi:hypothetical protein
MSARAALELLASRAKGTDPITKEEKPWPEFAEYECAACHHGLSKPSDRQKRDLELAEKGVKFRSGDLPWGTWYYALQPVLAARIPGGDTERLQTLLRELNQNLRKRLPPREAVAQQATEAANLLGEWLEKVKDRPLGAKQTRALFDALAKQDALVKSGWDGGTQVFLGLAAAHHALCDLDPAFQAKSPLRAPLVDMRKNLRESFGEGARPLYDSPLKYNSGPLLKDLMDLRNRLK